MYIKNKKSGKMLYSSSKMMKKIKNLCIIITYKCGFSNNYFMKNKDETTKTNTNWFENHIKLKNMEKVVEKENKKCCFVLT